VVCEPVRYEFEEKVVEGMRRLKMGDPFDEGADLGPLAAHDKRDQLHRQVRASIAAGARCLLGGRVPDFEGAYYPPTVLTDVPRACPARDEELFGPVASILPVADEDEAIAVANATPFGLGACVFTSDEERGERIATERLEAASCFVNDLVRSDPRLPIGGVKESGYGRELGRQGIRELVNLKTVCVA
jgi:succinate-semialdehyde dehydrogenase/glutarate-semialdehyde dehydrogenase